MKNTLSLIQQQRLQDLIQLSNHGGRDQWHGLQCHHIENGQFTATYADLAERWGVSRSVVYSTIKKFIKLGLITAEKFQRATLFTILPQSDSSDQSDWSDRSDRSVFTPIVRSIHPKKTLRRKRRKKHHKKRH